ncbi:MAG: EF-hand domain-containing protein [Putridiphycobacter sp.]|nr:EF-hand domain-containing protein [Putridiphycobacter sp.]
MVAENATNNKPKSQSTQRPPQPNIEDLFKMDINRDGMLTKLEVTGPILEDFDKIDLNKDGFMTREELGQSPKPQGPPPGGAEGRPLRR